MIDSVMPGDRLPKVDTAKERPHRTLLDEHFRVLDRQAWCKSLEEMQKPLNTYLQHHNNEQPHKGRSMNGRTPYAVFLEGLVKGQKAEADVDVNEVA